jgi:hypothetical protein
MSLIEEMRIRLALDLDPIPTLARRLGLQTKPKRKVDSMVVGSSNANMTARALGKTGHSVCNVCKVYSSLTVEYAGRSVRRWQL